MSQCAEHRAAISAIADGEDPGIERALVERHVARCRECRKYADAVAAWPPPRALAEAPAMPDLSRRVVKLNAVADRAGRWQSARVLLAVVAVEILVLSVAAGLVVASYLPRAGTRLALPRDVCGYAPILMLLVAGWFLTISTGSLWSAPAAVLIAGLAVARRTTGTSTCSV